MQSAQGNVHLVAASVGFVSLAMLWVSAVWGIVLKSGWALTRVRHATIYGIHQTCTLFGLCLGVVHALTQLAAPSGAVRVVDEWVPFTNPHDPFGIGIGVISLELMIALALSVLVQRRLGYHRWRTLHLGAYLAFTLLVGHVLLSGSDIGPPWVWGTVTGGWLVTIALWLATVPRVSRLPQSMQERLANRLRGRQVTVNVDPSRCARFGFCEHEAPTVFTLRGDGRLAYRSSVPGDEIEAVVRAARVCPARAIVLSRLPTTVVISPTEQTGADDGSANTTGRHHVRELRRRTGSPSENRS